MSAQIRTSLLTFAIVAASSFFFCSKAVFVKLAYRYGLDPVSVLALRMAMALPFFLVGGWWDSRSQRIGLSMKDTLRLALLGFFGWYLSSIVNFMGLQHVSVGLERMILYTYPSLVLLGSVIFLKKPLRPAIVVAMVVAYLGIYVGYRAEVGTGTGDTLKGALLVFASGVSYAVFVVMSGEMIQRIGPIRFTSWVVSFSAMFVLIHFSVTHVPGELLDLPREAYACGAALAVLGTVIPSYLFGWGLKRAGAQAFAVISMVGPPATVGLAWMVLGESTSLMQLAGLSLTLGGGLAVSLLRKP